MEELKTKLLDTKLFIDNEWLDKYVNLVLNSEVKQEKFKTQKHHILQVAYFTHYNLPIDNSEKNLINLLYKDHVLAHYYLMKCTTDWLKWANQSSFWQMIGRKNIDGFDSILASLDNLQEDYEDFCKTNSANNLGENNGNYGNFWTEEQRKTASIKAKEKARDPIYRKNISNKLKKYYENHTSSSKGKKAYFSLTEEKVVYRLECPEGYTDKAPQWFIDSKSSTFKKNNKITQGFVWYTNGEINIHDYVKLEDCPEGFRKGQTRGCKNYKLKEILGG